jgi:hypothetical protein
MFDVTRDEDEAEVEDQNDQDLLLTLQEDHVCARTCYTWAWAR